MTKAEHIAKINQVMPRFYTASKLTVDEAKSIIKSIEPNLLAIISDYQSEDADYRLGVDTYGYKEEDILHHLAYISDRWGCAFRIAWMLGLVNEEFRGGQPKPAESLVHIIVEGANSTNCNKSRNQVAISNGRFTAKQFNLVTCPDCIRHPSDWCKIPSSWRHRESNLMVRALAIVESGAGWNIRIKDEWMQQSEVEAETFRRDYIYLG